MWAELQQIAERFELSDEARAALREWFDGTEGQTMLYEDGSDTLLFGGDSIVLPSPVLDEKEHVPVALDGGAPATMATGSWLTPRYQNLGKLGEGGMGVVYRVRDRELNRVMALKVLRTEIATRNMVRARFVEEAQATAQLEHPGIIPVHDFGRLMDGRYFFTMKEVKGETLSDLIDELHEATFGTGSWAESVGGWTLARVIGVYARVCEAVAHAHVRGVVHRDLKPDNIMVGGFGDVLVVDWGLAKILGRPDIEFTDEDAAFVQTDRSANQSLATRIGTVAGTPLYMSPEQARGEVDKLVASSDVYALGGILFSVLTGRAPIQSGDAYAVLDRVRAGDLLPLDGPAPIPEELRQICDKALAFAPEDRFTNAGELAAAIAEWQEGARKRDRALEVVQEASRALPQAAILRERAAAYRLEASRILEGLKSWDSVDKKRPGWELEDQALNLESDAELEELRVTQLLQAALTHAPDLPEAHGALAEFYRRRHADAEEARDVPAAKRFEALLRSHDRTGRHGGYLQGDGALSLLTDPPGVEVELFRYVERDRRLVPEYQRSLGKTPLNDVSLPMGSYLLVLRKAGLQTVRYPVSIGRELHWKGVAPGAASPGPVRMPRAGELSDDEVYVPAGWFWAGGDPHAPSGLPGQRQWLDGFVMDRHPVTNAGYLNFLDGLLVEGREADALRHAPRERSGSEAQGAMIYARDADGRFMLRTDSEGDAWLPNYPVLLVDWHAAVAASEWRARTTKAGWTLPTSLQWEKAARGVDARFYPWGDRHDPSWANLRGSRAGRVLPAVISEYESDESPYGVRGLAGNSRDWCLGGLVLENGKEHTEDRATRGGSWSYTQYHGRVANRIGLPADYRSEVLGFRLVRPFS